jgi:pyruvate, water dikinase
MTKTTSRNKKLILWFNKIGIKDVPIVGGKNASLGEMYQKLTSKGVNVPNGFAITAHAYKYLIDENNLQKEIKAVLKGLDTSNVTDLAKKGKAVRELILNSTFPEKLNKEIEQTYNQLCKKYGKNTDVAVRSSATAEDLPDASFAGQQETYLNIRGTKELLIACKKCFASLFTNRAISYRTDKHFDHFKVKLSIGVQKMVRSDKATSGVMFSIDTESGFKNAVLLTAAYGLGENVVQGAVNPDSYYIFKPTLKTGFKPILEKRVGEKKIKMIYTNDPKNPVKNIKTTEKERKSFVLTDDEILQLARWSCIIEDHYKKSMDMEWAQDGITKELFIVQARPETVQSRKDVNQLETYHLTKKGEILITGQSVGAKAASGIAHVINDVKDIKKFKKGEILVTDMTDPDWEPIMKIASAIVTNRGGRTCHAAIISRELGVPCVVGTNNGTKVIQKGKPITVSCAEGEEGFVYKGIIPFNIARVNVKNLQRPKTKIMMNLGNPERAFEFSFIPNDGVGLAREEFIINEYIKIHPKALLHFNQIKDLKTKQKIESLTYGYQSKKDFFINKLAQGISMITAAFYPKPVIIRLSDFKSNEYANLIGGKQFEPKEDNPMIGWRGASRYYSKEYKEAFGLECEAILKVRNEMGLTNLKVMIPFPRTIKESKQVIQTMKEYGLKQGQNNLQIIGMCEIPSNVILADQFLDIFDGFSIGTNDLTQLTLGVDRDSELVAHVYDERNEAVKILLKQVIKVANKKKKYIGICGQCVSDFEEMAKFVVECGIKTMSLNPDTVIKTTININKVEKSLGIK